MNHAVETLLDLFNRVDDKLTRKHIAHALKRQIHLATQEVCTVQAGPHDNDLLTRDELSLARDGNRIAAIKAVRERTHVGLRECKQLVEWVTDPDRCPMPDHLLGRNNVRL